MNHRHSTVELNAFPARQVLLEEAISLCGVLDKKEMAMSQVRGMCCGDIVDVVLSRVSNSGHSTMTVTCRLDDNFFFSIAMVSWVDLYSQG